MSDSRTQNVFAKLAGFRAAVHRLTGLTGANWAACAVFGFVAVTLAFDYGFWLLLWQQGGLKAAYRVTLSSLCSLGVLYVLWQYLINPMRVRLTDDDLALRVERHYPELRDRLISTVQFARGSAAAPRRSDSRELIDHVVSETTRTVSGMDFNKPLDWGAFAQRAVMGGSAIAMLAALFLIPPQREGDERLMSVWFERNVLFLDTPYPGFQSDKAKFRLEVLAADGGAGRFRRLPDGRFGVLGDAPLDVVVRAEAVDPADDETTLPDAVTLRIVGDKYETPIDRTKDGSFPYRFGRVTGDLEFEVRAKTVQSGEVKSGPFAVVRESPAALAGWTIRSVPPSYTGMRPIDYDSTARNIEAEAEGTLVLAGWSDEPLRQVRLTLRKKAAEAGEAPVLVTRDLPNARYFECAAGGVGRGLLRQFPSRFEAEIGVNEPGTVILSAALTDCRGYATDEALRDLEITVRKKDEAPKVSLFHPGTGDKITPAAVLRLELRATDDRGFLGFDALDKDNLKREPGDRTGRTGTNLMFRVRAFAGDGENTTTLEGSGGAAQAIRLPAGTLPDLDARPYLELVPADETHPGGRARWTWEPNAGAGEKTRRLFDAGDKIDVWVVAKDNCRRPKPVELFRLGGFAAGTDVLRYRDAKECSSEVVRYTVVEADELLRLMTQKRRDMLRTLRSVQERQEDLATFVSRWGDELRKPGVKIDSKLLDMLTAKAALQTELARQLSRAGDVLAGVHDESELNRLGKPDDRVRLNDRVVLPLRCLSAGLLRTRENVLADPWLKNTFDERKAELARLGPIFADLEKKLGRGPLVEDIAAEMNDLAAPGRSAADMAKLAAGIYQRQKLSARLIREIMEQMQLDINSSLDEIIRLLRERVIREQVQVQKDTLRLLQKDIEDSGLFKP